jgi:hypothetical protein
VTAISIGGYPETIAQAVQDIIDAGNTIYVLVKAKATAEFIVVYGP